MPPRPERADDRLSRAARRPTSAPTSILRDLERAGRCSQGRQLQLVFAGKAHPADRAGKAMVTRLVRAIRQWPDATVFLENYDMGARRAC